MELRTPTYEFGTGKTPCDPLHGPRLTWMVRSGIQPQPAAEHTSGSNVKDLRQDERAEPHLSLMHIWGWMREWPYPFDFRCDLRNMAQQDDRKKSSLPSLLWSYHEKSQPTNTELWQKCALLQDFTQLILNSDQWARCDCSPHFINKETKAQKD